ncbi:MAG: hypothetical protein AAFN51_01260, partial [Pseudomonadota bacterium]
RAAVCRSDDPYALSPALHVHTVGDFKDVIQRVADQDHGQPLRLERLDQFQRTGCFLRAKSRRGVVRTADSSTQEVLGLIVGAEEAA